MRDSGRHTESLHRNGVANRFSPPSRTASGHQRDGEKKLETSSVNGWGYTKERDHPLITIAVQSLAREGIALQSLPALRQEEIGGWAKEVAACVEAGQCCGGVVFCRDPGIFCCVSNKVPGLRAVPVNGVLQAVKATLAIGANLLAVEMPGRTFFEIKQILRLLCTGDKPCCPEGVACTLRELDGHAHR